MGPQVHEHSHVQEMDTASLTPETSTNQFINGGCFFPDEMWGSQATFQRSPTPPPSSFAQTRRTSSTPLAIFGQLWFLEGRLFRLCSVGAKSKVIFTTKPTVVKLMVVTPFVGGLFSGKPTGNSTIWDPLSERGQIREAVRNSCVNMTPFSRLGPLH